MFVKVEVNPLHQRILCRSVCRGNPLYPEIKGGQEPIEIRFEVMGMDEGNVMRPYELPDAHHGTDIKPAVDIYGLDFKAHVPGKIDEGLAPSIRPSHAEQGEIEQAGV